MIDFDYFNLCCEQHLEHLRVLDILSCSNEEDSDILEEIIDIVRHSFFQSFKVVSDRYFFPLTNVPNHPEWCSEFLFDNNTKALYRPNGLHAYTVANVKYYDPTCNSLSLDLDHSKQQKFWLYPENFMIPYILDKESDLGGADE